MSEPAPKPAAGPRAEARKSRWAGAFSPTGPLAAAVILALFWAFMLASLRNKSLTVDEIVHATAGYTYWRFDDFRLNPENGNLPQRWDAIPLLGGDFPFPSTDSKLWHASNEWAIGDQWFHQMGNSVEAMLFRGRAAAGLFAVALGALIWACGRRLFGPAGGMLSLALAVLNPSCLAYGGLINSDMACSLFFLAATVALWAALHRLSPGRILGSALLMGGLFVCKMSAILIVPIGAILVCARLLDGRPLPVEFGRPCVLERRSRQAAAFAGLAVVHVAVVVAVIWAFFGFRYSAFAPSSPGPNHFNDTWAHLSNQPLPSEVLADLHLSPEQKAAANRLLARAGVDQGKWSQEALDAMPVLERTVLTSGQTHRLEADLAAPPTEWVPRVLEAIDRRRWLPQAYVFGWVYSWKFSHKRLSFLNGQIGLFGWRRFFPYTVMVKTPLPMFALGLLALGAAVARWRTKRGSGESWRQIVMRAVYATLPFWTLALVYGGALVFSRINIGHRHILAAYGPLLVLCGSAAVWPESMRLRRGPTRAVAVLVVLLAAEVLYRFPNYIAYFNILAGGPAQGYRHLVDSSLDWGQDLPGVKRYIEDHRIAEPCYLSYFGTASPAYYRVPARLLYSLKKPMLVLNRQSAGVEEEADVRNQYPDYDLAATARRGAGETMVLLEKPAAFRLTGGTYFISATMLEPIQYEGTGPWGPWNPRFERKYEVLRPLAAPFLQDDPAVRLAALKSDSLGEWITILNEYDEYRFARLTAYLRHREPDDTVNDSILVYKLTDADIDRALNGPPPESGADVLENLESRTAPETANGSP